MYSKYHTEIDGYWQSSYHQEVNCPTETYTNSAFLKVAIMCNQGRTEEHMCEFFILIIKDKIEKKCKTKYLTQDKQIFKKE